MLNFWIKIEDQNPYDEICNPTSTVVDLDVTQNYPKPFVLHLNGSRLKSQEKMLAELHNPLIIKKVQMRIFIDGILENIELIKSNTIESVIKKGSTLVNRTLKDTALDINNEVVGDLDKFILETNHERILYFKSHDPKYSHGGTTVSTKARKDPEGILKFRVDYNLYAHWLCLETYSQFCSEPNLEAKSFSEIFQQIMNVRHQYFKRMNLLLRLCCAVN